MITIRNYTESKKSPRLRSGWSFAGHGLPIQPMKKVLKAS
jgi:hypothetical protein